MPKITRLLVLVPLLALAGCTDKFKEPAEGALKAADAAAQELKSEEVAQYAPGPAKAIADTVAAAKAKAAAKEYEAALGLAKDVPSRVKDVVGQASQAAVAAAEAKKAAVAAAWEEARKEGTAAVAALHERLGPLKKAKSPPKGWDKKKLADTLAKGGGVEADWAKVGEKAKAGALEEAAALAKDVTVRARDLAATLPAGKAAAAKAKAKHKK